MKRKARQPVFECFAEGQDLPLFSGSPMRCNADPFIPSTSEIQPGLFGRDTFENLAAEHALSSKIAIARHQKKRRRRRKK